MTIVYFSATGNSLYVAKQLGQRIYSIPQLLKQEIKEIQDDVIGLVLPVYAQIIDPYFEEFLSLVKLKSSYLFAILTHGKAMGMAGEHLYQILQEQHLHLHYLNSIQMVDNYLPMFCMQDQINQEPHHQIQENITTIHQDIQEKKEFIKPSPQSLFLPQNPPKKAICEDFVIEAHCNGCGICVKVCPLDNIILEDQHPTFMPRCIDCLACIHNCPCNAIRLKGEQSPDRYRHKGVSLQEIVEANQ